MYGWPGPTCASATQANTANISHLRKFLRIIASSLFSASTKYPQLSATCLSARTRSPALTFQLLVDGILNETTPFTPTNLTLFICLRLINHERKSFNNE